MSKKPLPSTMPQKKEPEKKKIKVGKIIIITVIIMIVALLITWLTLGITKASSLLNPERNGLAYIDGPAEIGMVYETFELKNFNGDDNIVGWWIPSQDGEGEYVESNKTIIFSHNYQSNREMRETDGLFLVRYLVWSGYNVITFDYTGSGNSKGKNYTFGVDEKDELKLVVDYACDVREQSSIALYGFAFGSAAAIVEGCGDERISVIIADSPYLDLESALFDNLSTWSNLPNFIFSPIIEPMMNIFAGEKLEISPYDAVMSSSGKSFLFLHGEADTYFPSENSSVLSKAAEESGNYSEYTVFPDARHEYSFVDSEDNYVNTVTAFLEEHFN
ncbi:MAG TPA: hypothetical protein DDY98_08520 [Ruminococcaceae bacterium]|nr:hypothetical protein [Oscillospiraceae bacterium]